MGAQLQRQLEEEEERSAREFAQQVAQEEADRLERERAAKLSEQKRRLELAQLTEQKAQQLLDEEARRDQIRQEEKLAQQRQEQRSQRERQPAEAAPTKQLYMLDPEIHAGVLGASVNSQLSHHSLMDSLRALNSCGELPSTPSNGDFAFDLDMDEWARRGSLQRSQQLQQHEQHAPSSYSPTSKKRLWEQQQKDLEREWEKRHHDDEVQRLPRPEILRDRPGRAHNEARDRMKSERIAGRDDRSQASMAKSTASGAKAKQEDSNCLSM